jgi:predicted ferric reductase
MKKRILYSLFGLNVLCTLLFSWFGSAYLHEGGSVSGWFIFVGRITGLVAQIFILVELLLVSRISCIEKAFAFDKMNVLHRNIGMGLTFFMLTHPLFLILGYSKLTQVSSVEQFSSFLFQWDDVFNAFLGLFLIFWVGMLSMKFFRKKFSYEVWHAMHLLMYVGIILVFGHQLENGDTATGVFSLYWFALNMSVFVLFFLYRFVKPIKQYFFHQFMIEQVIQENAQVTSILISGKHMEKFQFTPGQFIHVSFFTKGMWQPHPFSLSAAPNGKNIRLTIKAIGDYTGKISGLKTGTKVFLEGPFGKFTSEVAHNNKYLFIAGGIGITPIRSMIENLSPQEADMVLLYANRTPSDVVFQSELAHYIKNCHYIYSADPTAVEKGFIDEEKLNRLAGDFCERDIYVCGPPPMMKTLIPVLEKCGVKKSNIHFENFSY